MSTAVTLKNVRLSYAYLWEPKPEADPNKKPKYQTKILVPKDDPEQIKACMAAIEEAKKVGMSKHWGGKLPPGLHISFRDGDNPNDTQADKSENAGHWFCNATSFDQPEIVDLAMQKIIDRREIYSGVWVNIRINFYPYKNSGNNGIAVGLGPVQKVGDDTPLSGQARAADVFERGDDTAFLN